METKNVRGAGRKKLPAGSQRIPVTVTLPPELVDLIPGKNKSKFFEFTLRLVLEKYPAEITGFYD